MIKDTQTECYRAKEEKVIKQHNEVKQCLTEKVTFKLELDI